MSGLIHWATGKAKGVWSDALGLARSAYHAWQSLVHVLATLFADIKGAWGGMVNGALAVGRDLAHLATSSFVALRHIVGTVIPHAVGRALRAAVHYARVGLHNVEHLARHLVANALHYASRIVRELRHWAAQHIAHLVHDLANALDLARKAYRLADGIAHHPQAFAAKLAGFLFHPLVQYLLDHSEAFLRAALRKLVPGVLRAAHIIESVITDLI